MKIHRVKMGWDVRREKGGRLFKLVVGETTREKLNDLLFSCLMKRHNRDWCISVWFRSPRLYSDGTVDAIGLKSIPCRELAERVWPCFAWSDDIMISTRRLLSLTQQKAPREIQQIRRLPNGGKDDAELYIFKFYMVYFFIYKVPE